MFLDIQMPGMSGFDVLTHLPQDCVPLVVFVTAYDQYAIRAFDARAVDYLLKPVDDARFATCLDRVRDRVRAQTAAEQRDQLVRADRGDHGIRRAGDGRAARARPQGAWSRATRRSCRSGRGARSCACPCNAIDWIDAAGDYMCIHASGNTHILRGTMKDLEQYLDPKLFQRVHRSTIVNLRRVKSLRAHMNGEYFLTLDGGNELKLSRTYRDKVEFFLKGATA